MSLVYTKKLFHLGCIVDGKNIVSIHPDGGHAVGGTASSNAVPSILVDDRGGYGVTVVTTATKKKEHKHILKR